MLARAQGLGCVAPPPPVQLSKTAAPPLRSMNFMVDQDSEPGYDVPALAVGLLFALPFVRSVMPDVPDVGIAVDVLVGAWGTGSVGGGGPLGRMQAHCAHLPGCGVSWLTLLRHPRAAAGGLSSGGPTEPEAGS